MGLKCSILGHRFEETDVEREREEQGSEVVTTIRELETCTRCGERQVVSENKEVTTLATPEEVSGDESAGDPQAESEEPTEPVDSAEIVEETTTASVPTADADDGAAGSAESGDSSAVDDPEPADDAVIIEEDADDRDPGEWPDEPTDPHQNPADAADWPDDGAAETDDAGYETPLLEETDDARPASEADVTVPEGTYRCDECGFTTEVESSSLRRGDFCPDCHRGTLVQDVDR